MNNLIIKHTGKLIAFSLLLVTFSCSTDTSQKVEKRNWQLVWNDDFDGTTAGELPDASKWSYDIGKGNNGWGNQELQYYTNRPENISKDGKGNLVITALKEDYQGASYTSARIKTKGLLEQTYGRFEARLKTPYGQGLWPAFWMLGNNSDTATWPSCGEIDIMELKGNTPNIVHSSIHGPGYSGVGAITDIYALFNDRLIKIIMYML